MLIRLFKIFGIAILLLIALLIVGVLMLQQPRYQTMLANALLHRIETQTGARAEFDRVDLDFPRTLSLRGFYLEDPDGDTLLFAGSLHARLTLFRPLKRQIHLSKVSLDDVKVFMDRPSPDAPFNFGFLLEPSQPKPEKSASNRLRKPLDFKVSNFELSNLSVRFNDADGIRIDPARVKRLSIEVRQLDLEEKSIDIRRLVIDQPYANLVPSGKHEKPVKPLESLLPDLGWTVRADAVEIREGGFTMDLPGGLPLQGYSDSKKLDLRDINLEVNHISLDSLLRLQIARLTAAEAGGITVGETAGNLEVTPRGILAEGFSLAVNQSRLDFTARLDVPEPSAFLESAWLDGKLKVYADPADANLFLPADKALARAVLFSGRLSGTYDKLQIAQGDLAAGNLRMLFNGRLTGAGSGGPPVFDISLAPLTGAAADITAVAPWISVPPEISQLGRIRATGRIWGEPSDLRARLDLVTQAGDLNTDLTLNMKEGPSYSGRLDLDGFDVRALLPDSLAGRASGWLEIRGTGMEWTSMKADMTGGFTSLELKGYTYSGVDLSGRFNECVFEGDIAIADECAALDFSGSIDLSDTIPEIKARLMVDHADLEALNLFGDKLVVTLGGEVHLTGTGFGDLNGSMLLHNLKLENNNDEVNFETTTLTLLSEPDYKQYDLFSPELSIHVRGDFDPVTLPRELRRTLSHYIYYVDFTDTAQVVPQRIEGEISLAEGFGLTRFLIGDIELPDNLEVGFRFDNSSDLLDVRLHSNYLAYRQYAADTLDFSLKTSAGTLNVNTTISEAQLSRGIRLNDLALTTASTKDYITWKLSIEEEDAPNRVVLAPEVEFIGDSILIHFVDSYLKLNNTLWPFNEDNQLVLTDEAFVARNFSIHNRDQYLEIINASNDLSDVSLEFHRLDLPALANIVQLDTIVRNGLLSGIIRVDDPLKDLQADIGLVFESLQVFDYACDTLEIDAYYRKSLHEVELVAAFKDPEYDLTAIGNLDLRPGSAEAFDLDIDARRVSLSFIDKIIKKGAKFDVMAQGDLRLEGSFRSPVLLGNARSLDTNTIHIDFLGLDLIVLEEDVEFRENAIDFMSMNVYDVFGNVGFAEGELRHSHFKDMSVDASIAFDNFNLLNTTQADNDDFYGRAFADGRVSMSGLTRNINMDIDVRTNPGTHISIPVASAGDVRQYENIVFINPFDSVPAKGIEELLEIKGINLDFQLEVTPDAQIDIVLNTESDNNLIAYGQGDIDLRIDQDKQLSMYGQYNIRNGKYVFNPQNLISKRFDIQEGSYINWTGKPFEAELNIIAAYNVNARVDNILQDSTQSYQTVPMDVIIEVGGTLDNTEVSFDIRTEQTGITRVPDEVTLFLNDIKDNEGEVTTQAISLLIVNRFLPSNTTVFGGTNLSAGDFGKTTAFELISNQISNYLTDAISKLITEAELNFNFTQRENLDVEEPGQTTEFQVDFKTSFVQNRIIVKVGGNFEVNDAPGAEQNNIAGDFEVEGLLTRDGRLRGKAYHRTADYDIFNQDRSKTGVGISYQKDFDRIGEVFRSDPARKQRRLDKRRDRRERREAEKAVGGDSLLPRNEEGETD